MMNSLNFRLFAQRCTILAASMLIAGNTHAGSVQCEQEAMSERLTCKAVRGIAFVVGYAVIAADSVANAISKRTPVTVELPDGSKISGSLSRTALQGRKLTKERTVKLGCKINPPQQQTWSFATCELEYPALPPVPTSTDYYTKTGKQASYTFPADKQGVPDGSLIRLERPLRWEMGVGL